MEASKKWDLYLFWQPRKLATSNLVHNLDLGLAYQKTLRVNIGGGLGYRSIRKWDPYFFLQPLKQATSNLVYNLCSGISYQKQLLGRTKLAWSGSRDSIQKNGTPY